MPTGFISISIGQLDNRKSWLDIVIKILMKVCVMMQRASVSIEFLMILSLKQHTTSKEAISILENEIKTHACFC